jgi:hypothetical protein
MLPALLQPLLASGLNLVGNAVLAKGKEWVEEKTGVDLNKASLDKDDLNKLQQFELEHEEELLKLKVEDNKISAELEKEYLKDVQNARSMQMAALNQDDLFSKRFIYYLAIFWSIGGALYIAAITFFVIPEANTRFADTILGFLLGTIIAQILSFFYGSSSSSQRKDGLLKAVAEKKGDSK